MRTPALEYAWPAPAAEPVTEREIEAQAKDSFIYVCAIWDAAGGGYRAMNVSSRYDSLGTPVFGLASGLGGPHRTIRAAVEEVRRFFPGTIAFRNGREVYPPAQS
jgi:hypothetical protein